MSIAHVSGMTIEELNEILNLSNSVGTELLIPQLVAKGAVMYLGRLYCVISKAVRFHWFPHALRYSPNIYHWLWFTFGIKERN